MAPAAQRAGLILAVANVERSVAPMSRQRGSRPR